MGRVWIACLLLGPLAAGCTCEGGSGDAGIARDAAAPCPEPTRLVRYDLSPEFGEPLEVSVTWSASLGERTVYGLWLVFDAIDPYWGTPTTEYRTALGETIGASTEIHPLPVPADVPVDLVGVAPIQVGDRLVFHGGDITVSYSADGWSSAGPALVVPGWRFAELIDCGGARFVARLGGSETGSGDAAALIEWTDGGAVVLDVEPYVVEASPAPPLGALPVFACSNARAGEIAAVFQIGGERPRLIRGSADGSLTVRAFGSDPISGVAFHGDSMMTIGRNGIAHSWRVDAAGTPVELASRDLRLIELFGRGHAFEVEGGTLFVFSGSGLVGLLATPVGIADPWHISSVTCGRVDDCWTGGPDWLRPALVRFCEGAP